jgi:hypothetical protein
VYKFIGVLSIPLPPPRNLQAQVNNLTVTLTWQKPVYDSTSVTLQGYNVYRDNVKINASIVIDTSYNEFMVSSGHYTYCVTSVYTEGESSKTCQDVTVIALGNNTLEPSMQIQVYPNPVENLLHIRSAGTINDLRLTDLSGREVYHSQPENETVDIPVTSFHSGIYLLSLQTMHGSYHLKVMIR